MYKIGSSRVGPDKVTYHDVLNSTRYCFFFWPITRYCLKCNVVVKRVVNHGLFDLKYHLSIYLHFQLVKQLMSGFDHWAMCMEEYLLREINSLNASR